MYQIVVNIIKNTFSYIFMFSVYYNAINNSVVSTFAIWYLKCKKNTL